MANPVVGRHGLDGGVHHMGEGLHVRRGHEDQVHATCRQRRDMRGELDIVADEKGGQPFAEREDRIGVAGGVERGLARAEKLDLAVSRQHLAFGRERKGRIVQPVPLALDMAHHQRTAGGSGRPGKPLAPGAARRQGKIGNARVVVAGQPAFRQDDDLGAGSTRRGQRAFGLAECGLDIPGRRGGLHQGCAHGDLLCGRVVHLRRLAKRLTSRGFGAECRDAAAA